MDRKKLRATCIVMVVAPWRLPPARGWRGGAQHADVVDAPVLVEALVLGGEHRVLHDLGDLRDPDDRAALLAELADQHAVGGVDAQRDLGPVVGQRVDRREVGVGDSSTKATASAPRTASPASTATGKANQRNHFNGGVVLELGARAL